MSDANELQHIVWQATEGFFIISAILYIFLFIFKAYLKIEAKRKNRFKLSVDNYLNVLENIKKEKDLVNYAYAIGDLLLKVDKKERIKIESELEKRELFQRVYNLYKKTSTLVFKLHIFSSLTMLQSSKIRSECFFILRDKKILKKIPEFILVAIRGIVLSSKNQKDLIELYDVLEFARVEYYKSKEFLELSFVEALTFIENRAVVAFIKSLILKEITLTTYSFLEALLHFNKEEEIYEALLYLKNHHKEGYKLNKYIFKIEEEWGVKEVFAIKNHSVKINRDKICRVDYSNEEALYPFLTKNIKYPKKIKVV